MLCVATQHSTMCAQGTVALEACSHVGLHRTLMDGCNMDALWDKSSFREAFYVCMHYIYVCLLHIVGASLGCILR